MDIRLQILTALTDNFIYLLVFGQSALVIDPSEAKPVLDACEKDHLTLKAILITHHHADHTGGIEELTQEAGAKVIGPDDKRIPGLNQALSEEDSVTVGPFTFEVIETPGHTSTHVVYYEPKQRWLFSGDTLFCAGCGRLFEGTPEQMLASLNKLKQLPDDTLVYCGHDYTEKNCSFAHSLEPGNQEVERRWEEAKTNKPTVPSTIALEKTTNPFMRADDALLKQALDMPGQNELAVFREVRAMRDRY